MMIIIKAITIKNAMKSELRTLKEKCKANKQTNCLGIFLLFVFDLLEMYEVEGDET